MLKNLSFMSISTLARLCSGFILFIFLARVWGADSFGTFMYPYILTTLATIVIDYGFGLQLVRDISRSRNETIYLVSKAFLAKLLLTFVVFGISWLVILFVQTDFTFTCLYWVLLISSALNSFGLFFSLPLRAHDCFHVEARTALIANFTLVILASLIAALGGGPLPVAVGFVIARIVFALVATQAFVRKFGRLSWQNIRLTEMLEVLRSGFPFGVHLALSALYFQADTLVIQHFLGRSEVGVYQAGMRLLMGGLVLTEVLSNVFLPAMARQANDTVELAKLTQKLTQYLLFLGGCGYVVLAAGSPWIVSLLYGSQYAELVPLLPLFAVILWLRYGGAGWGLVLTVANKQSTRMQAVTGAFIFNILLNIALIPNFGLKGAIFSSLATHIVLNTVYWLFSREQFRNYSLSIRSNGLVFTTFAHILLTITWANQISTQYYWYISVLTLFLILLIGIDRNTASYLSKRLLSRAKFATTKLSN